MPTTIKIGAGDRPRRSNGALGRRQSQAPPVQIVEAEADEDDGRRRQNDADHVDLHIRPPRVGLEAEAQKENDGRNGDQNSECRAPADEGAQNAADHERQHAGGGARRTQRAHRRRLLTSFVVFGDERHQRRHDHRAGRAAEGLRRDHRLSQWG